MIVAFIEETIRHWRALVQHLKDRARRAKENL